MKTDDLIDLLCAQVEPVDPRKTTINFLLVVIASLAVIVTGSVAALGFDFAGKFDSVGFLALKLGFSLSVLSLATYFLIKHLRPGGERRTVTWPTTIPFVALAGFALIELASSPVSRWHSLMIGNHWLECITFILFSALAPAAVLIAAARSAAPTDQVRTGALAGVVAGTIGAVAYALHCTDDSISFVAVWYAAAIVLCGFAGALLGPRLLRW